MRNAVTRTPASVLLVLPRVTTDKGVRVRGLIVKLERCATQRG